MQSASKNLVLPIRKLALVSSLFALSMLFVLQTQAFKSSIPETKPTVNSTMNRHIYLVRHAEKQSDDTADPALTEQGINRAILLASLLKDKNIVHIFSTEYQRTLQTAQPLAKTLGLEIQRYDPRELSAFAQQLNSVPGNLLIVGHSNTTPDLATLLDGEEHAEIDETEYDNLFDIQVKGDDVITEVTKY